MTPHTILRAMPRPWVRAFVPALVALLVTVLATAPATGESASNASQVELGRMWVEDIAFRSGLGIAFVPPDGFLEAAAPIPGVESARFIQAVYADATVPAGWDSARATTDLRPSSQAALVLASVSLAEHLAASGDPDRMALARLAITEAKAVADYAIVSLRRDDGRYVVHAARSPLGDASLVQDAAMLTALDRLSVAIDPDADPHGFADPAFAPWFRSAAADLATVLASQEPTDVVETTMLVRALTSHARATGDQQAFRRIAELSTLLVDGDTSNPVDRSRAAVAVAEAGAVVGDYSLIVRGLDLAGSVADAVDVDSGVLRDGPTRLTASDVAAVVEALDLAGSHGARDSFVTQVVLQSGMTPPIPTALETLDPGDDHAGAETGTSPWAVASAVSFASGDWSVTDPRIDTEGALTLATTLLRVGSDAPAASTAAMGTARGSRPVASSTTSTVPPPDRRHLVVAIVFAGALLIAMSGFTIGMSRFVRMVDES